MKAFLQQLGSWPILYSRLFTSLVVLVGLLLIRRLVWSLAKRHIEDPARLYRWRRSLAYGTSVLAIILVGRIWIEGLGSIVTFLGLISAGIAVAMHDTIANIAGWAFILWRRPFKVGDRIQIGEVKGDVIDISLFQFSMIEVGNWVSADQSTGRIVHVPNSKVLRETLANYELGFAYVWHEVPVLITFESDWRKAKGVLKEIAAAKAEPLSQGAAEQIRRAAMRYLIYFDKLTPIVYTTVKDSGVLLTIRYIVKPRQRRGSEEAIWEAILDEFAKHDDITLAYPTTRFYQEQPREGPPPGP
ncbi:MAG: mechanosensitive ion channel [Kiritimatiellae bacterium]|nr:mechanosensitive ion channel [Kiritimatiellia bacterium]